MQLATGIARTFQLLFSIVALGLSITLGIQQIIGAVPPQTKWAESAGTLGVVAALFGIIISFLESWQEFVPWLLDLLAGIALLAAGIAYAVTLGNVDCDNTAAHNGLAWDNVLISGGCEYRDEIKHCYNGDHGQYIRPRCVWAKVDTLFMFLGFAACVGVMIVTRSIAEASRNISALFEVSGWGNIMGS
ncbi:hypothetical protein N7470_006630 [Penicillium chermesinum]|nr:hypothetical protein N7470_006630 [Penicillium chermesinum]